MKLSKALTALCFTLIAIFFFSIHFSISGDSNKEEYWMGIYSGDDRIGYSYNSTQQDKDLTKVLEFTSLSINLLGKESEVKSRGSYILEGYKIISFEYEMNSDDLDFKATGKRAGGNLQITLETVSGKSRHTVPVKEELILPSMVSKIMVDDDMKTGDTFKFILFEPLSILMGVNEPVSTNTVGQRETVKLRKGEFWAYKVESNFMGSEITLWIDDEGDVIKQEFPPGLTSIKESKEEILSNNSVSFDIVSETSIHSDSELKDPGSLKHMKVKLGGIDVSNGLDINDGYRQKLDGHILEIDAKGFDNEQSSYDLPYDSSQYQKLTESEFLIQSSDKEIVSATNAVVGGEKNPAIAARKINNWIFKNLEKSATPSLPSAKDVLKTKVGDCNEHAVLFTAMARSAGIPTKIALGIMYFNNSFAYHAWNEVYLGKWVAVDSTFGQFPADATHIKFIEGNLARSGELSKVVGKLNIEIIDAS